MDFFARQAAARRLSRWLLGAFMLATGAVAIAVGFVLAILFNAASAPEVPMQGVAIEPAVFAVAAMATAAFIGLASLWRLRGLRDGGGSIAVDLGGERVTGLERDPLKRRLHNVVEEMAIAAGLPVPEVYVLENEPGINAFAAGLQPSNAAIAVTRGALERLSRDELQGVVGHEFSHILNGDMRLNARLMGYVFGLVAVSMAGRLLLRGGAYGGARCAAAAAAAAAAPCWRPGSPSWCSARSACWPGASCRLRYRGSAKRWPTPPRCSSRATRPGSPMP
jgi:Zn-dependent protease with chaperone function